MLILAIDTALDACAAAVLDTASNRVISRESQPMKRGHAEALMPNIGLQGAVSEIVPNLIQAGGGIAGGLLTYTAYRHVVGQSEDA